MTAAEISSNTMIFFNIFPPIGRCPGGWNPSPLDVTRRPETTSGSRAEPFSPFSESASRACSFKLCLSAEAPNDALRDITHQINWEIKR
jgi:hypothetical protein